MKEFVADSPGLVVVGLNHRTAPIELREKLAFTPESATAAITALREKFPDTEAVVLSTCNRVEIYVGQGGGGPRVDELADFLAAFHSLAVDRIRSHLYCYEDRAVVEHLFAVASSLDSMVVGETQILSQVKSAYQHAVAAGAVGKVLHALFQRALAAARDVHGKTSLASGRLSVASVAVELARAVFDRFEEKVVLCVGAGKMASLMLRHLAELQPRELLVANRSIENAQAVAVTFGGQPRSLDELDQLLIAADIVLTSTGSAELLISKERFRALLKARKYRPIVMIDIAVPRDIAADVGQLQNVYLYNVDDLQAVAVGNRERRDERIAASRAVLAEHVEEFLQWLAVRDVGPMVKELYARCHKLVTAELETLYASQPDLTPAQRAQVERLAHRLVGKILHEPVTRITTCNPLSNAFKHRARDCCPKTNSIL
ncbi:MAG: glutamyl-tRNA reductase [Phycisphaerales bacterium]|nr:glutamyl-tRNA reductase [Phycisphaerales bacterium]